MKGAGALLLPVSIWYLGVAVQVAVPQQTPPTQKPEAHSLGAPQVCPFALSSRAPACTQPHSAATAGAFRTTRSVGMNATTPGGVVGRPNHARDDCSGSTSGDALALLGVIFPALTSPE